MKYAKPERLLLQSHPEFNERWVQERLAEDATLLGLGHLILKDKERLQPRAGRLDLLFQAADSTQRYEVEVQLGRTDEAHIIRTLEYWDIERKRYPQYDHIAVLVAEDVTSRFLNIISLFNGFIPLVVIQMQAYRLGDQISLVFTKVLDQMSLGLVEEDEVTEEANRPYWEKQASKTTLEYTDQVLAHLQQLDPEIAPKYNKSYIGLTKRGRSNNFVSITPKRDWIWLGFRLERSQEVEKKLEQAALGGGEYDSKWGKYWVRLTHEEFKENQALIQELLQAAYQQANP